MQIADPVLEEIVSKARTLVIIDDESSTGNTFLAAGRAMAHAMPCLERIETCCITDWSAGRYLAELPVSAFANALISGTMEWERSEIAIAPVLAKKSNRAGRAPENGMGTRRRLGRGKLPLIPTQASDGNWAACCLSGFR